MAAPRLIGIMLGAFGIGAVIGALFIGAVRDRLTGEQAVAAPARRHGGRHHDSRTEPGSVSHVGRACGRRGRCGWSAVTLFNIGVQLSAPRWVAGRSLAGFQASIAGGIAIGSWGWGVLPRGPWRRSRAARLHRRNGDTPAPRLVAAHAAGRQSATTGSRCLPIPEPTVAHRAQRPARGRDRISRRARQTHAPSTTSCKRCSSAGSATAPMTGRSRATSPIPELWTERYHCPTWLDYLRHRSRYDAIRTRAAVSGRWTFTTAPIRCGSAACSNGRSDRCAGRTTPPTAPPARSCPSPPPLRAAARESVFRFAR